MALNTCFFQTWSNCACVNDGVVKALSPTGGGAILGNRNSGGAAVSGMCSFGCRQWITYTCLMAVGAFVLMMASVPGTTICLRWVWSDVSYCIHT